MSDDEKADLGSREHVLESLLWSPAGRMRLAASMIAPLVARRNYQSLSRQIFPVEQIEPCLSCGSFSYSDGASAGCRECLATHVMES